jgi:AraC-like DNA-binding protein
MSAEQRSRNTARTSEATTIASLVRAVVQALEARGIDSRRLLAEAGLECPTTIDPYSRVPDSKFNKLVVDAVAATGDPAFGLEAVAFMRPAYLHALGFALFASNSLQDFFQRLARYMLLVSNSAQHALEQTPEGYRFVLQVQGRLAAERIDAWFGFLVEICRELYRPDFRPRRLEFTRPEPRQRVERFLEFFQAPITFSAAMDALYFDRRDMVAPLFGANPELARQNERVVVEHLERLGRLDTVTRVQACLIELLKTGEYGKEKVAERLGMSLRTLHDKLAGQGMSFQHLLDDLRCQMASEYLLQEGLCIKEITFLLGYTDTGNFSRAFKRWTGQSPREYRLNQGSGR